MKKILALICTLIICVSFASVAVNATETETVSEVVTEAVETETETVEEVETVSSETDAAPIDEVTIDNEKYAQQFIDYVFSGAAGSTELMDKIIEMGEQFSAQKEAGYTFEERIKQLITPENNKALCEEGFAYSAWTVDKEYFLRLFLRSPFVVFGAMIVAFTIDVKAAVIFTTSVLPIPT